MISLRQLLVVVLVIAVLWLLRGLQRRVRDTLSQRAGPAAGRRPRHFQNTVRCARCGVYLPRDEAVERPQGFLCADSDTCQAAGEAGARKPRS